MLKVSIITIVYNNVNGISKTIESVLNQSYSNIEYIIIDGGSTDGTIDTVKKYNVDTFVSEQDGGISDAFNKGIKHAKGEIIGIINSGDYYEHNAVELVVETYNEFDGAEDRYYVLHGNIRMFKKDFSKIYAPLKLQTFKYQLPIWHPTVFVNKKVYLDFEYNTNYKVAMDYELLSKIFNRAGTFIYVNSVIANMDIGGISNTQAGKGFKEVMNASRENLKIHKFTSYFYYQYRNVLHKLISLTKNNA